MEILREMHSHFKVKFLTEVMGQIVYVVWIAFELAFIYSFLVEVSRLDANQ